MALDPALAGLLGALVGGAATFGGSLFGNRQQARHERKRRAQERKLEAYTNAMRSLMRAAYPEWRQDSQSPGTSSAKETQVSGEARLLDAAYSLTVLTTACGSKYRAKIEGMAREMTQAIEKILTRQELDEVEFQYNALLKAYWTVVEAARDDIGFVN